MDRYKPLTQPVPDKKAQRGATKQMEIYLNNDISASGHVKQHLPQTIYTTDGRNHATA